MAKRRGTKKRKQTADGRNGGIVAPTSDQSGMNDRTPPNPNFWPKYFTQGTVAHEAVHNLTGKSDTQLQVLFNILAMVRLRGRLAADGRVEGLGLASGEWTPQQKEFARLAMEHLRSWRLEPNGSAETPLDISIDLVDEIRSAPMQVRVGSSGEGVTALHVAFSRTDGWALPSR